MTDRFERIRELVAGRADELVELLKSFIPVRSENPPGTNLVEAQTWLGDRLSDYDIAFDVYDTARADTDHAVIVGEIGEATSTSICMATTTSSRRSQKPNSCLKSEKVG